MKKWGPLAIDSSIVAPFIELTCFPSWNLVKHFCFEFHAIKHKTEHAVMKEDFNDNDEEKHIKREEIYILHTKMMQNNL